MRQLGQRLDKYKQTFQAKLIEIAEKESRKRAELVDKEEALILKQREHDALKDQLEALDLQIAEREADIERMRRQRE